MLLEPDYAKRHRMFEFVPKSLDELVPRGHLLRRVEACIDFRSLVAPMAKYYDLGHGRPAVHPEVLVRALVIAYLYGIASFRKLCTAIHENISFRWFLFLGLEDEVFDHSTISVFLRRVGGNGFRGLLRRLNEQLRRNGLLSDEAFVDSTLVPAAVSCQANGLSPTTLSPEAFAKVASEENGVFSTCEVLPEKGRQSRRLARRRLVRRWYQDARGRLPLHPPDRDARWRKVSKGRPAVLSYKQHILVDRKGFILAQRITHATTPDPDAVPALLADSPVHVRFLAADTGYSQGRLRRYLARQGIEAHIPNSHATSGTSTEADRVSPDARRKLALSSRQDTAKNHLLREGRDVAVCGSGVGLPRVSAAIFMSATSIQTALHSTVRLRTTIPAGRDAVADGTISPIRTKAPDRRRGGLCAA